MSPLKASRIQNRHVHHSFMPAPPARTVQTRAVKQRIPAWARRMLHDQRGLNTVELVVIIAIVIGLALLFRTRINGFVTTLLDGLFSRETANELVQGIARPQ